MPETGKAQGRLREDGKLTWCDEKVLNKAQGENPRPPNRVAATIISYKKIALGPGQQLKKKTLFWKIVVFKSDF